MYWYLKALKQYSDFTGRARRTEYWMFLLINLIFSLTASLIDTATGSLSPEIGVGTLGALYSLFLLIPGLAVLVRRLHDTGQSGWMALVGLIPFLGFAWLLLLLTRDSQPGENAYGPNPKEFDDNPNNQFL